MAIDTGDRLAIHELAARYGRVIDDRDWDRLGEVFTDGAVFRMEGFGPAVTELRGLAEIGPWLTASQDHPVAHHVTNVEVFDEGPTVGLYFKLIGPGRSGRVGSADYRDEVVHTVAGWRIARHVIRLRRPEQPDPDPRG